MFIGRAHRRLVDEDDGIGILDYIFKYSIRPHLFIKHTRNIDTPESGCFASGSTFFEGLKSCVIV